MTNTQSDKTGLSAAEALRQHKALIEETWAAEVRKQIQTASRLDDPVLFNYIPGLLQRLSEALEPDAVRLAASDFNTSAQEHGGERARLTNFDISQVSMEFSILKETLHTVLDSRAEISPKQWRTIDHSIDRSLRESVAAFALAESYIREQFIAMLAHDIRGPVAFIKMATSLLLEGVDAQTADDLYQRIRAAAESAGELIDNILDANVIKARRRIKLGIQSCDLRELAQKVIQQFQQTIQLEGNSLEGYWCPRALSRALHNLIDNAIKYGDNSQPIVISIKEDHGIARLAVHNKGDPIPLAEQEMIFQPFHRSNPGKQEQPQGWGFGLPIVRGIVEAHGGTIDVDSSAELGTTITLSLPLDARPYQNRPTSD